MSGKSININGNMTQPLPPIPPSHKPRSCLSHMVCLCFGILFTITIIAIVYHIEDGHCSFFDVEPQIQINSVTVSPINLTYPNTQSFWTIGISFNNSRQAAIIYRNIEVGIYRIGDNDFHWTETAKVESFRQGPKNESQVFAIVKAKPHFSEHMEGIMSFNVTLWSDVGCKRWYNLESKPRNMDSNEYKCRDLKVEFNGNSSEGIMSGGKTVSCYPQNISRKYYAEEALFDTKNPVVQLLYSILS